MPVLLIDVDSTIPNIPLMKLSAYWRAKGEEVYLQTPQKETVIPDDIYFDRVYISVIFKRNRWLAEAYAHKYDDSIVDIGGSGYDLKKQLPDKIDLIFPDYDLYGAPYSQGFTTRGCIRHCSFCIVREKEGKFRRYQHPCDFHDPKRKAIMIMDNNWLADPAWFYNTSDWIIRRGLKVYEHGLDARLVDAGIAEQLRRMNVHEYHFALDNIKDAPLILPKLKMMMDAGVPLRSKGIVYVYCDGDHEFDSALARCKMLKGVGVKPYIMPNIDVPISPRVKRLKQWANAPQMFFTCDFEDYRPNKT